MITRSSIDHHSAEVVAQRKQRTPQVLNSAMAAAAAAATAAAPAAAATAGAPAAAAAGIPPTEFLCPISLEVMRDPVTASSGATYDRSSIEKWLDSGHTMCPSTMQPLDGGTPLVPNFAMRRLIHAWCREHHRPTKSPPHSPLDHSAASAMVDAVRRSSIGSSDCTAAIRRLRAKARESVRNSRLISDAGAASVLASVLASSDPLAAPLECGAAVEEAVAALALLPPESGGGSGRRALLSPRALRSVAWVMRQGAAAQFRMAGAALLDSLATDRGAQIMLGSASAVMDALVAMLRSNDGSSRGAALVNSSLRTLLSICAPNRNRVAAAAAGAPAALIELLPNAEGAVAEHVLLVLELVAAVDQGRDAVACHALAIPVIVKKVLRISDAATDYAVSILWRVCCSNANKNAVGDTVRGLGLFGKLLLLLRRDLSPGTRRKVVDILDVVYNAKMEC